LLIRIKRKPIGNREASFLPVPFGGLQKPLRVGADQRDGASTNVIQRAFNGCRRRDHGLLATSAQLGKTGLDSGMTEEITRSSAGQSNCPHGQRIKAVEGLTNLRKVSAQSILWKRFVAGHTDRRAGDASGQERAKFCFRSHVSLWRGDTEGAMPTVIPLAHLHYPLPVPVLLRNIAWHFSPKTLPDLSAVAMILTQESTHHA
jgi:hypothetical protein